MDINRARRPRRYGRKPAGQALVTHQNRHRYRLGEAWAVGLTGFAALTGILYAASVYTQW